MKIRDNIRQMLYTLSGILCVIILLAAACLFPKYYSVYRDRNTLNRVNYIDVHVNTYKAAYSSIAEKLTALARAAKTDTISTYPYSMKKHSLNAVQINEPGAKMSRGELTKITNREFADLYNNGILNEKIEVKKEKMTLHERYTIYAADESDFQGFSCWKLIFETKKKQYTLYLDEEYHKIYYLKIQHKNADKPDKYKKIPWGISKSSSDGAVDSAVHDRFDMQFYRMLQYYEISVEDSDTIEIDTAALVGSIQLDKQNPIILQEEFGYDNEKNYWSIGTAVEEMIHF